MDNKTGKFILSLRQEKGLSQYQLAEMIPISRQAVSKWERGENIPDSYTLLKLSELFNVSINELLIGERTSDNSIESLEATTLTILDQSNKKSRKIKRMLVTFTTIIVVLLLSFLTYYFITSYNSIKVYIVGGDNNKTFMKSGILMTTKEKYYLKLGELKLNSDKEIINIKFCYIKNGKEKVIAEDNDIDNLNISDNYGYSEKFKDINEILHNSYLKIIYSDNEEEILKLIFKRDFTNNSLFRKRNKKWKETIEKDTSIAEARIIEDKEENKEKEIPRKEQSQPVISETKIEELKVEEKTIDDIVEMIKEKGTNFNGTYTYIYSHDGIETYIIYYEIMRKISIYNGDDYIGDYFINMDRYNCGVSDCNNNFKNILIESLF